MKEKEGARRSGCEILVEGEEQEGEGKGEGRLPPSFSGDSSGEETYDDSIEVCRLLSLAISSSELEEECGEDPRSSGGCRGGRTTRTRPTTVDQLEHFRVIDDVAELKSSKEGDNKGGGRDR